MHTTPGELRPTRLLDAFRAREGSHFSVNEIYAKRELETPASEQRLPPSVYEVALVWDGPQDLDLHALVRMEDPYRGEKGRGTPLSGDARERHVFWRDQGRLDGFPFAKLGGDDGVEEDPGPKEESIRFDAARLDRALFFVQHSGSSTSIEGLGSLRMLFRGPHIEGSSDLETRFEVDLLHGLDPKGSMRWCQGLAVDCSERGKVSVRAMARTCDGMPRLDATPSQPPTPPAPSEQQRLRQLFFGRERHLFKELDWLLEATKEAAPADAPSQERPDFSCARRLVGHRTECEEGEQVYSENRTRLARVFGHCCDQLGLPREQVKLFTCHLSTTDCLATANTHSLSERGSVYQVCIPEQIVGCLDDGELAFLLGHELGHVMLEHPSWDIHGRNVKVRFPDLADIEENTWQRHLAAEITADRMGLLCCEDLHAAFAMLWRLEQMKPGQTFAEHRQLWAQEGKNQKSALQNLRVMFHGRSLSEHWQKIREDLQRTPRKLPTHPPTAIRFRALELAALDVLAFASDAEHFDWRAFRAIDKKISEMWQV
ncbi:MAG: M48 family metalloprotease [Pseudomonadota bacterium]